MPSVEDTVYCPRCDKPWTAVAATEEEAHKRAMALMQEHLVKHPDYDPEMFDE